MRKALLLLPISLALLSCSEIKSEEVGVKRTFGKIDPEELSPGLHFYFPVVQSINKVPVVVRNYEMRESQSLTQRDNPTTGEELRDEGQGRHLRPFQGRA